MWAQILRLQRAALQIQYYVIDWKLEDQAVPVGPLPVKKNLIHLKSRFRICGLVSTIDRDFDVRVARDKGWLEWVEERGRRVLGQDTDKAERDLRTQIRAFETLLANYSRDQPRLSGLIEELVIHQAKIARSKSDVRPAQVEKGDESWWAVWLLIAAALVAIGFLLRKRALGGH